MPSTTRSSVRPKSSKQPWGTILQPEFGMGYQEMTDYEIKQTVVRLYKIPISGERPQERPHMKDMSKEGLKEMVKRLSDHSRGVPDSRRTQEASRYKKMGIVNSFAWKGYN